MRLNERVIAAHASCDIDAGVSAFDRVGVLYDRRRLMGYFGRGHEAVSTTMRSHRGPVIIDSEVIAERGEHVALFRQRWHSADRRSFVELLAIVDADPESRLVSAYVFFDDDDVEAAHHELERRSAEHGRGLDADPAHKDPD